jgi:hypothetical protein
MGADFTFAFNEMEATRTKAYKNARHLSQPVRVSNTVKLLEDCGIKNWNEVSDVDTINSDEMYEFLKNCIDVVYDNDTRECGFFIIDHRVFHITGGMSWGDYPSDVYEQFAVCQCLGLTLNQPLGEFEHETEGESK